MKTENDKTVPRVAFQGEPGAFSEAAIIARYGDGCVAVPEESFDSVFAAVEEGRADRALLPIENSLAGSIHRNYDLLLRHDLHIVAELHLHIRHNLMALPGVTLDDVVEVISHPMALAQCEHWLAELPVATRATRDTAGSARMVRDRQLSTTAAIASRRAAEVYGLAILESDIQDDDENWTRFIEIAREPVAPPPDVRAKTSIVFSLKSVPGALFKALSVFALRDIDLTKIESRPLRGSRFQYLFYLDFACSADQESAQNALRHLSEIAPLLRVLGSYPHSSP